MMLKVLEKVGKDTHILLNFCQQNHKTIEEVEFKTHPSGKQQKVLSKWSHPTCV